MTLVARDKDLTMTRGARLGFAASTSAHEAKDSSLLVENTSFASIGISLKNSANSVELLLDLLLLLRLGRSGIGMLLLGRLDALMDAMHDRRGSLLPSRQHGQHIGHILGTNIATRSFGHLEHLLRLIQLSTHQAQVNALNNQILQLTDRRKLQDGRKLIIREGLEIGAFNSSAAN